MSGMFMLWSLLLVSRDYAEGVREKRRLKALGHDRKRTVSVVAETPPADPFTLVEDFPGASGLDGEEAVPAQTGARRSEFTYSPTMANIKKVWTSGSSFKQEISKKVSSRFNEFWYYGEPDMMEPPPPSRGPSRQVVAGDGEDYPEPYRQGPSSPTDGEPDSGSRPIVSVQANKATPGPVKQQRAPPPSAGPSSAEGDGSSGSAGKPGQVLRATTLTDLDLQIAEVGEDALPESAAAFKGATEGPEGGAEEVGAGEGVGEGVKGGEEPEAPTLAD